MMKKVYIVAIIGCILTFVLTVTCVVMYIEHMNEIEALNESYKLHQDKDNVILFQNKKYSDSLETTINVRNGYINVLNKAIYDSQQREKIIGNKYKKTYEKINNAPDDSLDGIINSLLDRHDQIPFTR